MFSSGIFSTNTISNPLLRLVVRRDRLPQSVVLPLHGSVIMKSRTCLGHHMELQHHPAILATGLVFVVAKGSGAWHCKFLSFERIQLVLDLSEKLISLLLFFDRFKFFQNYLLCFSHLERVYIRHQFMRPMTYHFQLFGFLCVISPLIFLRKKTQNKTLFDSKFLSGGKHQAYQ